MRVFFPVNETIKVENSKKVESNCWPSYLNSGYISMGKKDMSIRIFCDTNELTKIIKSFKERQIYYILFRKKLPLWVHLLSIHFFYFMFTFHLT